MLSLNDDARIRKALTEVVSKDLSVRATERLVQKMLQYRRAKAPQPAAYRHAAALLTSTMSTKVRIEPKARGTKGRIVIDYYSKEDLTRLVDWLARTDQPVGR